MYGRKLVLILMTILFVLAACGIDSEGNTGNGSKNSKWAEIQESGEMIVGTSGTLIAASYYEGEGKNENQLTGYDVEVMKEVAKRLDLDVSYEIMGIDSMLPAIKSGRIDVAANDIEITSKRKEKFNFSSPYKYSYSTMVVRKGDYSGISSLEDLEGKVAGGGATTVYSEIARHFGVAKVKTYGNAPNEAYLRDVHNGRTDVIINDYYLSKFGVSAFPEFDIMLHPELEFHPTEQAAVLPEGADKLTKEINHVLDEMRKDGTLTKLAVKFYKEDASKRSEKEIKEIEGLEL